jgi:hypothetical protein
LLKGDSAFARFLAWSDWLWQTTAKTHGLTPENLVDALFDYLTTQRGSPTPDVRAVLLQDYLASGARARPICLQALLARPRTQPLKTTSLRQRQGRHGQGQTQLDL